MRLSTIGFVKRGLVLASLGLAMAIPAKAEEIKHVLLISIDGMHAVDLSTFVARHPGSALASLATRGVMYTGAMTSAPSDSFPGILAQVTGGSSKSHEVYYDVSYDRSMYAPGSNCQGNPGTQTTFDESIDKNSKLITGGGTLGQPLTQIDSTQLPMALVNGSCVPVYPHQFVKVNTIFNLIHGYGRRTAWADKHPAYDLLNGPSGDGIDDLFTPEVDSNDSVTQADTTTGFHSIQRNDQVKVQAILNEIAGKDSTGMKNVDVPAIFGMNFQAVSVGQKLAKGNSADPQDAGLIGGYADAAGRQPNNGLELNLAFVNAQIGQMLEALSHANLIDSTLIIISAKHGQSPINVADRQAVDDAPYTKAPGYSASITDDVGLVWLAPQAQKQAYASARRYLEHEATTLGITQLLDRSAITQEFEDPFNDDRAPDFIAVTKHGLIYTGGSKLAEHGGFSGDDRNVGLLVSNPRLRSQVITYQVQTSQIAPTILNSLGYPASKLRAVQMEHTSVLPGLEAIVAR